MPVHAPPRSVYDVEHEFLGTQQDRKDCKSQQTLQFKLSFTTGFKEVKTKQPQKKGSPHLPPTMCSHITFVWTAVIFDHVVQWINDQLIQKDYFSRRPQADPNHWAAAQTLVPAQDGARLPNSAVAWT